MNSNISLLWKFMKGNRFLYISSIIAIIIATVFTFSGPLVIRTAIDSIIGNKAIDLPDFIVSVVNYLGGREVLVKKLWILAVLFVFLNIMRGIFMYLKGKWSAMASESIAKKIKDKLYDHIQHLSYETHLNTETGDLIQRSTSDVETIRQFLSVQIVEIARTILFIIVSITVMFSLNTKMTLITMIGVPFILGFALIFFTKIKKAFKKSDEAEAKMSTVLQENLTGVRVVRAFARQAYEIEKFNNKNIDYRDTSYELIRLLAWYWALSDLLTLIQKAVVLIFGIYMVSKGDLTIGTLVVFMIYVNMLLWPIRQLGRILTDMGKALVSLKRIKEILDKDIEESSLTELKPKISGEIEFKDVVFSYDDENKILNKFSFKAKKGETIAILGPTGSGKSSLMHLLLKLYDYDSGSIKIDGVELKLINKKWIRKHIGIALQEPFLFSKTINDNIALSVKDKNKESIVNAAKTASIHDVIENFKDGYDTAVGEQGVTLSGGQKQRIAIARTIIRNAPIYIFDDSLSAVDTQTDMAIREALEKNNNNSTTFVISHRISTLSKADKILVIDNGILQEEGKHEDLIKKEGFYKRIWDIQNNTFASLPSTYGSSPKNKKEN